MSCPSTVVCFRKALHGLHSPPLPLPSAANTTKMAWKARPESIAKVRCIYSDESEALPLRPCQGSWPRWSTEEPCGGVNMARSYDPNIGRLRCLSLLF